MAGRRRAQQRPSQGTRGTGVDGFVIEETGQVFRQGGGAGVAPRRVLGQAF